MFKNYHRGEVVLLITCDTKMNHYDNVINQHKSKEKIPEFFLQKFKNTEQIQKTWNSITCTTKMAFKMSDC